MFSLSKGQRQQPSNSAASVGGAPASSAVAAASAETSAAEPVTSGTVPSAASIKGAVDAHESSAGAVSSDPAAEGQRRPAVLLPLLRRRRGRLECSRQQLGSLIVARRGRSARGVCDFIPEGEYRCGDCHLGRAPFRGVRRPARGWHIRGAKGDTATRDQYACELDLGLCHFDAERAFVQSDLDEVVYISLPSSCGALSGKVEGLRRSLYGLNQASRTWHYHLVGGIKPLGFEQCEADVCVMRSVEDGAVDIACLSAC